MSISSEAFQLIRAQWEQRERESMLLQVQAMLQIAHRTERKMEQKENQALLLKAEAISSSQHTGRLRRLSSLQAITNFTKEAFTRRRTSKISDSSSYQTTTPSHKTNNSGSSDEMATPKSKPVADYQEPRTVIRHAGSVVTGAQPTTHGVRIPRSKTTSFLPVLSKPLPDIPKESTIPSQNHFHLHAPATATAALRAREQEYQPVTRASVAVGRPHSKTIQDSASRPQYSLYPKRIDSLFPPKPPAVPVWSEVQRSTPTETCLMRSITQPSLLPKKYQAMSANLRAYEEYDFSSPIVERNMPVAYWAGRYTSLSDHMRSQELSGELPTNAAMNSAPESPGNRMSKEERGVREILTRLYRSCENEEAASNLRVFQLIIARDLGLPNLRYFTPWPVQNVIEVEDPQFEEQHGGELTSKKTFMERLLSARSHKKPEPQGAAELYSPKPITKGRLWF